MTTLTKADLRIIAEHLASLRPPGPRPLTADQLVKVNAVIDKTQHLIATTRAAPERGELVFEWRVPRDLALTGNAYAGSRGWKKHKDRKLLDALIQKMLPDFPKAPLHGAHRRRWVRATRFSPKRVDECALDLIGAKQPLDALQRANVIHDDDEKFLIREALQMKAKPGGTHLLIEVFEIAEHQVEAAEPSDQPIAQIVRTPGLMTQMLIDGQTGGVK